ncbi:NO-inducible flavohemoprotein [Marinobacter sp. C2H3]|uniref:NO-inducible flavohemoprotein n=1 Tax=Marinobacter sp. C2H3 TaxID=3119003 RepID=UPI00300F35CF
MLSPASRSIIEATLPAVKAHANDITGVFYPLMFERYPEVKAYFNQTHQEQGTQRQALANAVVAYASNLDRLEALGDAVSLIVNKHVSLDIRPEHYPIVGECLLAAVKQVLGDAATDEVLAAWGEAYQQLADILISAEEGRYQQNAAKPGGWRGERAFVLVRKVPESHEIISFYFEPADGGAVADFQPGQFIGLILDIDGQQVRRNYSLSDRPGRPYYRISVKREPNGVASNFLHDRLSVGDTVSMTAPAGDFVLRDSERPLVLLSGGVGITPTLAMLEPALERGRPVHFLHGARNSEAQAFRDHLAALEQAHDNLQVTVCYSEPLPADADKPSGFFDGDRLASLLPENRDVDVYFLGPKPFMQACFRNLNELEIPTSQIHYEFFGPLQALA